MSRKKPSRTIDSYVAKLVTARNPKSPVSEAYRTIRTNIEFSGIDQKIKTLLVTSSVPTEGKSTVVANLGVSMAMSGKRTLIIDADLRNPTQFKCFNITTMLGLTNLLLDDSLTLDEVIACPEQENLFILTSGPTPPNPAELLGSAKMKSMVSAMADHFDLVLIDSPPVLAVADSSILSSFVDGVILVAASGGVSKDHVLSAKEQLQKVKANVLGVILNKVPTGNGSYYYSYYYGSH